MTTYTVRIETRDDGRYKIRTIECATCGDTFEVERKMPARGRWPVRHKDCAVDYHREQMKDLKRKVKSGEHVPGYAAARPLWNRSDHEGPGARSAMSNATAMAMTDSLSDDDTWTERDAVDEYHSIRTNNSAGGYPAEVKRAPAYTGDEGTDRLKRALANQKADKTFASAKGVAVGLTSPGIPTVTLDDEAREWLQDNPDWYKEPSTDDGGWNCRRGEFTENKIDLEEVYWEAGVEDDPEDDEFIKELNRELREEIDQYAKRMNYLTN